MKTPDDIEDNSIVLLVKKDGKIYVKAIHFDPKSYDDMVKRGQYIKKSLEYTTDKFFNKLKESYYP